MRGMVLYCCLLVGGVAILCWGVNQVLVDLQISHKLTASMDAVINQ